MYLCNVSIRLLLVISSWLDTDLKFFVRISLIVTPSSTVAALRHSHSTGVAAGIIEFSWSESGVK